MQKLTQKLSGALLVTSALMLMVGCGATTTNTNTTSTTNAADKVKESAFGFDYPISSTTAVAGEMALAPSRVAVDSALLDSESSAFVWYNATVKTVGEAASILDNTFDKGVSMPNALIVPIPAGQTAEVGDVVLTWWQSGSGMQRAIVVPGGTPTQPMVRYLDFELDDFNQAPDGTPIAEAEEQLKADSFYVLKNEYQVGSTVAYLDVTKTYKFGQVIHQTGDTLLLAGFVGTPVVVDKAQTVALPIYPSYAVGAMVKVKYISTFFEGTVTKVDAEHGRIYVEIDFGGSKKTIAAPFGNVSDSELL